MRHLRIIVLLLWSYLWHCVNWYVDFSKLDPEDGGSKILQTLVTPIRLNGAVTQETKIWTSWESEWKYCNRHRLYVAARICSEDGWNTQSEAESLIQYCGYDDARIAGELCPIPELDIVLFCTDCRLGPILVLTCRGVNRTFKSTQYWISDWIVWISSPSYIFMKCY